jgi:uncharacterized membrane protein
MLGFNIVWLLIDGVLLALFIVMPVLRGEDAFFGVRVSSEVYRAPGRQIVRRYWLWLILTFLEIEAVGLIVSLYRSNVPYSRSVSFPLLGAAFLLLYTVFYRQARELRLIDDRERVAASLASRRLGDYTNIVLEVALVILIVAPLLMLIYFYPLLPERIPSHWNWKGEANAWAKKSFGAVFMLPVTSIYLQGLFLLIKHGLMQVKMTLPAEHTEQYSRYKEQALGINMQVMDWLRVLIAVLLGSLSVDIVLTTSDRLRSFQTLAAVVVSAASLTLLIVCAYLISRFVQINRKLKAEVGQVYVQSKTDAEHWYGGGLFYYNPDDPALFVEKLVGFGYTINFGNKAALVYAAYLLALPLLGIWMARTF